LFSKAPKGGELRGNGGEDIKAGNCTWLRKKKISEQEHKKKACGVFFKPGKRELVKGGFGEVDVYDIKKKKRGLGVGKKTLTAIHQQ